MKIVLLRNPDWYQPLNLFFMTIFRKWTLVIAFGYVWIDSMKHTGRIEKKIELSFTKQQIHFLMVLESTNFLGLNWCSIHVKIENRKINVF